MPGCATRCTSFSRDSIDAAWSDIRHHFGPRNEEVGGDLYNSDLAEWSEWAIGHGTPVGDITRFGKWLIWRLSIGTAEYGNLPTRVRGHIGISCIPCPYDTASDPHRTRTWLGLDLTDNLPSLVDHGDNFLRVAQRGTEWGFECTHSGCTYLAEHGVPYFHA